MKSGCDRKKRDDFKGWFRTGQTRWSTALGHLEIHKKLFLKLLAASESGRKDSQEGGGIKSVSQVADPMHTYFALGVCSIRCKHLMLIAYFIRLQDEKETGHVHGSS